MVKKLKQNTGETLAETLVSVLVVGLAMIMLAGGIISAARMNRQAEDVDSAFRTERVKEDSGTVTIVHSSSHVPDSEIAVTVCTTEDQNAYCYYRVGG